MDEQFSSIHTNFPFMDFYGMYSNLKIFSVSRTFFTCITIYNFIVTIQNTNFHDMLRPLWKGDVIEFVHTPGLQSKLFLWNRILVSSTFPRIHFPKLLQEYLLQWVTSPNVTELIQSPLLFQCTDPGTTYKDPDSHHRRTREEYDHR